MAQMAGLGLPAGTSRLFDVKLGRGKNIKHAKNVTRQCRDHGQKSVDAREDETDLKWDECEVTGLT